MIGLFLINTLEGRVTTREEELTCVLELNHGKRFLLSRMHMGVRCSIKSDFPRPRIGIFPVRSCVNKSYFLYLKRVSVLL